MLKFVLTTLSLGIKYILIKVTVMMQNILVTGWLSFHTNGRLTSLCVLFVLSHSNNVVVHCSLFETDADIARTFVVNEYRCHYVSVIFGCIYV